MSRKTSTASEYTPENTYILNSRPPGLIDQTNVSYATESCLTAPVEQPSLSQPNTKDLRDLGLDVVEDSVPVKEYVPEAVDHTDALKTELNNSLMQKDVGKLIPGQKVNLKVFVLGVDQTESAQEAAKDKPVCSVPPKPQPPIERIIDIKLEDGVAEKFNMEKGQVKDEKPVQADTGLKVPQRKISRFLVSPVLSGQLDLPKDKDFGAIDVDQPPPPNVAPVEKTEPLPVQNIPPLVEVKPALPSSVTTEAVRKISAPLESTRTGLEIEKPMEQKISVCSLKEESTAKEETGAVCGPELINTLEMLKISLDNLKHISHPKKETAEGEAKKVSSNIDISSKTVSFPSQPQQPQTHSQPSTTQFIPPISSSIPPPTSQPISQPPVMLQPQQSVPQHQQSIPPPQQSLPQAPQAMPQSQQPIPQTMPQHQQPLPQSMPQQQAQSMPQPQQPLPQPQQSVPQSQMQQNIPLSQPTQQSLPQPQQTLPQHHPIPQPHPAVAQTQHQQPLPQPQQPLLQSQQVVSSQPSVQSQMPQPIPQVQPISQPAVTVPTSAPQQSFVPISIPQQYVAATPPQPINIQQQISSSIPQQILASAPTHLSTTAPTQAMQTPLQQPSLPSKLPTHDIPMQVSVFLLKCSQL